MKTQPIDHYIPSPLRETPEHKRTELIQQEIDLMRAMYQRQLDNQDRRDAMIGYSLLTIALALPVIVAAIVIFG